MELNREKLAWCAGFFDGEGNIGLFKRNGFPFSLCLSVSQVNKEVLIRFKNYIGNLGNLSGPWQPKGKRKEVWCFRTSKFEHVQAIVAFLWNFLGEVKRKQAYETLVNYNKRVLVSKGPKNKNLKYCPHGHEFTIENTKIYRGCRHCKTCSKLRKRGLDPKKLVGVPYAETYKYDKYKRIKNNGRYYFNK